MADRSSAYSQAVTVGTADLAVGAAGGTPAISYAAGGATVAHVLAGVQWSYSGGTPVSATAGSIVVLDGTVPVRNWDVTGPGASSMEFIPAIRGSLNTAMNVIGYPGGTAVVVKLNATHWTEG